MTAVYVKEQGAIVARRGERLVVKKKAMCWRNSP